MSNALALAARRSRLKMNPIRERGAYSDKSRIRHWREMAPTPPELVRIVDWMEKSGRQQPADLTQYLAYTGARIGEALKARWKAVNWAENMIHVKRSKKGLMPWVPILPEMQRLLARMKERATCDLMFPSALNPHTALDPSAFRRLLGKACKTTGYPPCDTARAAVLLCHSGASKRADRRGNRATHRRQDRPVNHCRGVR